MVGKTLPFDIKFTAYPTGIQYKVTDTIKKGGSIHAELRSLNLLHAVAVQLHQLEAVGGNLGLSGGAYFKPFAVIQ